MKVLSQYILEKFRITKDTEVSNKELELETLGENVKSYWKLFKERWEDLEIDGYLVISIDKSSTDCKIVKKFYKDLDGFNEALNLCYEAPDNKTYFMCVYHNNTYDPQDMIYSSKWELTEGEFLRDEFKEYFYGKGGKLGW